VAHIYLQFKCSQVALVICALSVEVRIRVKRAYTVKTGNISLFYLYSHNAFCNKTNCKKCRPDAFYMLTE